MTIEHNCREYGVATGFTEDLGLQILVIYECTICKKRWIEVTCHGD